MQSGGHAAKCDHPMAKNNRDNLKRKPFIALSQDFFDDPDVAAAGHLPTLLYLHMACRIRQLHSDGWLHQNQVMRLGFPRWQTHLRQLIEVGLVTQHQDANLKPGYYLPGYLKWNYSEHAWLTREHEGTLGACKRHHTDHPPCDLPNCQAAAHWLNTHPTDSHTPG